MKTRQEANPKAILKTLEIEPAGECTRVTGGWATMMWPFRTRDGSLHALRVAVAAPVKCDQAALVAASQAGLSVPAVEASGAGKTGRLWSSPGSPA